MIYKRQTDLCLLLLACCTRACSDNQAARNCISKAEEASPQAKNDPYLRLTHANIIMNMLPSGRYSGLKENERAKHQDYIHKVTCGALAAALVRTSRL